MNKKLSTIPRIEENPPYQRLNQRRRDDIEHEKARERTPARILARQADQALVRWLKPKPGA